MLINLLLKSNTLLLLLGFCAFSFGAELPRLTVTGQRAPRNSPRQGVGAEGQRLEIDSAVPQSLSRVLRESPSVTVREIGGEGTAPEYWVRGQRPHQTRFFLEGVPLSDAAYDTAPAHWLPILALGSTDVFAEEVPVGLGGDGLGGAIRFSFPTRAASSALETRVGSFGYREVGGLAASRAALVFLGYRESREDFTYLFDNGTAFESSDDSLQRRENNQFRRFTVFPLIPLWESARDRVRLFGMVVRNEMGVPGPVGQTSKADLTQTYALAAVDWKRGAWSSQLFGRGAADDFHNEGYATLGMGAPDSRSRAQAVGLSTSWSDDLSVARVATALENFRFDAGDGPRGGTRGQGRWQIESGFSRAFETAENVTIRPAVALHFYDYLPGEGTIARRQMFLGSPRVNGSWEIDPGFRARAGLGSFFRAPSLFEIYGTSAGFASSPDLKAERAVKAEVGLDHEWKQPMASVRFLRTSYTYSTAFASDLIAYIQNSQESRIATNIAAARIDSHELGAEVQWTFPLSWKNGVTFFWTENRTEIPSQQGRELPERPTWRWQSDLMWREELFSGGYSLSWMGPAFSDLANFRNRASSQDHSVWVGVQPRGWGRFRLEVKNLFDTIKIDSAFAGESTSEYTTGYAGFPAPGRRIYLSWHYDF